MPRAIRWFGAFVLVFLLTGVAGEALFRDADLPISFTSTMLALNVIGAGFVAFTLLASFANQRNAALAALRAEQEKSELLLMNILPRSIAERLKAASQTIADHFGSASILFAEAIAIWPPRACRIRAPITHAGPRSSRSTCEKRSPPRPSATA